MTLSWRGLAWCVFGLLLASCISKSSVRTKVAKIKRSRIALQSASRAPVSKKLLKEAFASKLGTTPRGYKENKSRSWVTTTYGNGAGRRRVARRRIARARRALAKRKTLSRPRTRRAMPSTDTDDDVSKAPPVPVVRRAPSPVPRRTLGFSFGAAPSRSYRRAPSRSYRRASRLSIASRPRRPTQAIAASVLKAGETDDNKRFDYYLMYHRKKAHLLPKSYRMDISERYIFQVRDRDNRSLPNCRMVVTGNDEIIALGRTDSRGQWLFFPRTYKNARGVKQFYVTFLVKGQTLVRKFQRARHGSDRPWKVQLQVQKPRSKPHVDILFLLDTTGSMSDEIARIQATLLSLTAKIRRMRPQPTIRYGMVLYRDRTDAYVTRRYPFTRDVRAFERALRGVRAAGGGDTPEAMNMGLYAAVEQMKWSSDSLRLMFLVADAPPQLRYADDVPYTQTLKSAVAKGIKIFPTAASGLDAQGSYIYRQIAQFTQASFLFIQYGAGTAASHGVRGPSKSNNLDDIVLKIVKKELRQYTR